MRRLERYISTRNVDTGNEDFQKALLSTAESFRYQIGRNQMSGSVAV